MVSSYSRADAPAVYDLTCITMLIDVVFFGLPVIVAICLAAHAVRDEAPKFWLPAASMGCYSVFYLFGGREIVLWWLTIMMLGGGVLNSGGLIGG